MARAYYAVSALLLVPLLALIVGRAITHPWDPEIILDEFVRKETSKAANSEIQTETYLQKNVKIPLGPRDAPVEGEAYLLLPKGTSRPPPLVVMAPGLGQQRDMGPVRFATVFAEKGLASLVLDYRTFGGSDGMPRNFVSPLDHVADILSAVAWVKSGGLNETVDSTRVALWGTSFGGGHVLVAGSKLNDSIAAIVSLVPHLSAKQAYLNSLKTRGVLGGLRILAAGLVDLARAHLGLSPAYVKLAGPLGSLSVMQLSPTEFTRYTSKIPPSPRGGWQMRCTARSALLIGRYSPLDYVPHLKVPVHMTTASQDSLCPPELADVAVSRNPLIFHESVDCSHFSIYQTESVKQNQAAFLAKHLGAEKH